MNEQELLAIHRRGVYTYNDMPLNTDRTLSQIADLAPESTMTIVLEALRELVDYELAVILDYDGEDTLRVHTATGPLSGPRLHRFSLSLANRPDLAALLAAGQPHLFATDELHVDTYEEILDMPDGHSCLAAPLSFNGRSIGLLTLDHRSCGIFSPEILSFIRVISRLIAIALRQSESTRLLRENNTRLLEERNRLLSRETGAFTDFIGSSSVWMEVIDLVKLVASADSPVLVLGETGTGKEEAARAIHRLSARAHGPFVALNCSALPASLAESELFGHEKGSFTGAQGLRKGRFELAHGGTLFLDEIGDLPPEIQPKLLRALQEGRFERVGGESGVDVDVRIIAATHVDLERAVAEGKFREDLFYRISVFPLHLPPLGERGDDVLLLAERFASRLRERSGWESLSFSPEALENLLHREWPGNVRELRNVIERAAILCRGGTIRAADLDAGERSRSRNGSKPASPEGTLPGFEEMQRRYIAEILARTGGRIYGNEGAAALLGMPPTTLQSKLKKLGLK